MIGPSEPRPDDDSQGSPPRPEDVQARFEQIMQGALSGEVAERLDAFWEASGALNAYLVAFGEGRLRRARLGRSPGAHLEGTAERVTLEANFAAVCDVVLLSDSGGDSEPDRLDRLRQLATVIYDDVCRRTTVLRTVVGDGPQAEDLTIEQWHTKFKALVANAAEGQESQVIRQIYGESVQISIATYTDALMARCWGLYERAIGVRQAIRSFCSDTTKIAAGGLIAVILSRYLGN